MDGKFALFTIVILLLLLLAPTALPFSPYRQDLGAALLQPGQTDEEGNWHPLGTDQFGRDLLSRTIFGARNSLLISALGLLGGGLVGLLWGALAGYFGGFLDLATVLMSDVLLSFPSFLVALGAAVISGPGIISLMAAIAFFSLPGLVRIGRSVALQAREEEYVKAAVSLGGSPWHVLKTHVFLQIAPPALAWMGYRLSAAMLTTAGLSFLGFGPQPPFCELGAMLESGRPYLYVAPHLVLVPGVGITLLATLINAATDGLIDQHSGPRMI